MSRASARPPTKRAVGAACIHSYHRPYSTPDYLRDCLYKTRLGQLQTSAYSVYLMQFRLSISVFRAGCAGDGNLERRRWHRAAPLRSLLRTHWRQIVERDGRRVAAAATHSVSRRGRPRRPLGHAARQDPGPGARQTLWPEGVPPRLHGAGQRLLETAVAASHWLRHCCWPAADRLPRWHRCVPRRHRRLEG